MTAKSNNITRSEYDTNQKTFMEKIDNLVDKVGGLAVDLAALPGNLITELDKKYAVKETEKTVNDLKEKLDNRNYEWIKYLVALAVGVAVTFIFDTK